MPTKKEIITTTKRKMAKGFLYFIDKQGDVSRVKRNDGHVLGRQHPIEKIETLGINKEPGYFYWINRDGNVGRSLRKNYKPA